MTAEHTEVGQWVQQGDLVADVEALDEVEIVAYVVEQHVPHVRVGAQVTVEVPAIPGQTFTGMVAEIVPQADVQARTFPVKVRVTNTIVEGVPLLKSGMYARVTLPTGDKQVATLVSKDALVLGGPQPLVYVVDGATADNPAGKAVPVPVANRRRRHGDDPGHRRPRGRAVGRRPRQRAPAAGSGRGDSTNHSRSVTAKRCRNAETP